MSAPRPGLASQIKEKTDNIWVQFFFIPIFFFLPTSLLVSYYSVEPFKKSLVGSLSPSTTTFLDNHAIALTVISLLITYLISNLNSILDRLTSNDCALPAKGLITLKEALEQIVQQKARRFESEYGQILNKKLQPIDVFKTITKPDQQIIYIAHALHRFLEAITSDIEFKVRIIRVDNNLPTGWYTFAPDDNPPKTEIDVLKNQDSAVSICLKKKSLFVVEDIKAAAVKNGGREYVMAHADPADEIGSLICYPIYHKQAKCYPFVLTVSANKPYFRKSREELYKWILEQFALRIRLEYSLILLKEHCENEEIK